MNPDLDHSEVAAFRDALADDVTDLLNESVASEEIADAGELERIAALLSSGLRDQGAPPELSEALAGLLEDRCDTAAATLLALLPELVPAFAARAAEALRALEAADVRPVLPPGAGKLRGTEARRFDTPGGTMYLVLIEREGSALAQVAVLTIAEPATAEQLPWGPLRRCILTPWGEVASARELLAVSDDRGEPASAEQVAADLEGALARNREDGRPVRWGTGLALPLLGLALRGRGDAFTDVGILAEGMELHVDPDDADSFDGMREATLSDFREWLELGEGDGELCDLAPAVADEMLRWAWSCDGRLGHWHEEDIEAFLLDDAPRRLPAEERVAARVGDCAAAFLRFLDEIELLSGASKLELEAVCDGLREEAADAVADRRRWGPAKALVAQMRSEGVEPTDQATLDAWLEGFNSRDRAERDRILGPPGDADLLRAFAGPDAELPDGLDSAVLPAPGTSITVGSAWFPPGEYERAREQWSELGELWAGIDYEGYARRFEATLRGWRRRGVRGRPVRVLLDAYGLWCADRGVDAAESRAAYAADQLRQGNALAWPPGRNEPCWCESGRKYKRCCGTVTATTLHPLDSDV